MGINDKLVCLALLGVIGFFVFVLREQGRKNRSERLKRIAAARRWSFDAADRPRDGELSRFPAFLRGTNRRCLDSMFGALTAQGVKFRAGDASYVVQHNVLGHGAASTFRFSYLLVKLTGATPTLSIRRSDWTDKMERLVKLEDVRIGTPEFREAFVVQSSDAEWAGRFLTARVVEFLMGDCPLPVAIDGGYLCLTDETETWGGEEFDAVIGWVERFLGVWPETGRS